MAPKPIRTWQLQSARSHFSEVVEAALKEGPQRVTRRGRDAVVVVSEAAWQQRTTPADAAFARHLLAFPSDAAEFLPKRRPARIRRLSPLG
jgi:antitoxin Phd